MRHLEREIDRLKRKLLTLSGMVEESVYRAIKAVTDRDQVNAAGVVQSDDEIDAMEVEVEEDCLKVLALYQPVAIDLRFIIAILKINNDLERIGDLSVSIAHRARAMTKWPVPNEARTVLEKMAERTRWMLKGSLEAMVNLDTKLARTVCAADSEVDQMNRDIHRMVITLLQQDAAQAEEIVFFLNTARNLERIADHATNIAEDVIYLSEGEIVRHGRGN